ncbi:MAG: PilZ domain-containing protein [Desulfosudaceae bacterium]
MPDSDQRRGTRVVFRVKARMEYNGQLIEGEVRNLSLKGMLVATDVRIPRDTELAIHIFLSGTTSEVDLAMKGSVVRSDETGAAIVFKEIDLDSFIHLRSVVSYNEGDEDKIMNEFYDIVHEKDKSRPATTIDKRGEGET